MVECLPNLEPRKGGAIRWGFPEPPKGPNGHKGRRIHNCPGQQDPNVIFSRDVMHQNKAGKS